jgi:hypothetical protein
METKDNKISSMRKNKKGQFVLVPVKDRFWEKVNKNGPTHPTNPSLGKCWMWIGAYTHCGYGIIWGSRHTRGIRAHRISWEIVNGKIPKGKKILHSCDNPPCVNPEHLRPGTDADNHRDMVERGRALNGEKNPQCKITKEQVLDILSKYPKAKRTGPRKKYEWNIILKLSEKYGITTDSLSRIARHERWGHL